MDVAHQVGVNQATVVKWRKRFLERGLEGLGDDQRSGAPRRIGDADVEAVVVRLLVIWRRRLGCLRQRLGGFGRRLG